MIQILTVLIFICGTYILGKNTLFLVQLCVSHHMVLRWHTFQSFSEPFEHRELNLMVIEAEIQMPNKIGEIFLKSPHPTVQPGGVGCLDMTHIGHTSVGHFDGVPVLCSGDQVSINFKNFAPHWLKYFERRWTEPGYFPCSVPSFAGCVF